MDRKATNVAIVARRTPREAFTVAMSRPRSNRSAKDPAGRASNSHGKLSAAMTAETASGRGSTTTARRGRRRTRSRPRNWRERRFPANSGSVARSASSVRRQAELARWLADPGLGRRHSRSSQSVRNGHEQSKEVAHPKRPSRPGSDSGSVSIVLLFAGLNIRRAPRPRHGRIIARRTVTVREIARPRETSEIRRKTLKTSSAVPINTAEVTTGLSPGGASCCSCTLITTQNSYCSAPTHFVVEGHSKPPPFHAPGEGAGSGGLKRVASTTPFSSPSPLSHSPVAIARWAFGAPEYRCILPHRLAEARQRRLRCSPGFDTRNRRPEKRRRGSIKSRAAVGFRLAQLLTRPTSLSAVRRLACQSGTTRRGATSLDSSRRGLPFSHCRKTGAVRGREM